jgi:hypothetical protein
MRKKSVVHSTCSGIVLFGLISATLLAQGQQAAVPDGARQSTSQANKAASIDTSSTNLPDSPDITASESRNGNPSAQLTLRAALALPSAQAQSSQSKGQDQQSATTTAPPQRPVGTAVAESPNASGIAASQPAGVAVAPAKQHRVRTIILRTGAIVGAGVAIGTVVALTEATPSKPPGAH